ncbi:MAG: TatD family hydrolase [Oscillospiraceae bacterium]
MVLFDTHAHYDDEAFDGDRDAVLTGLPEQGVQRIVNPGCTVESSRTAIALAEKYDFLYAAVGMHPENCAGTIDEDYDVLRELSRHPKVVAIGEIGLDYRPQSPPEEKQLAVFYRQLELARELHLPVIVHDREAHRDALQAVRDFPTVRGVFHCYSGSVEDARTLVSRGWLLGFNGAITFKNARKAPEVIRAIPLDSILLETDSPYLAPVPHRGRRNDSHFVGLVAEQIGAWLGRDPDEVAKITMENGKKFFGIK